MLDACVDEEGYYRGLHTCSCEYRLIIFAAFTLP